jgi:2-succinyl-5-enolpyruvyl-6-hydroxy-3-cyclohexene-1-carboxylate synthase
MTSSAKLELAQRLIRHQVQAARTLLGQVVNPVGEPVLDEKMLQWLADNHAIAAHLQDAITALDAALENIGPDDPSRSPDRKK